MNLFKISIVSFFISISALASTLEKGLPESKSNFPEMDHHARNLMAKLYARLSPTELDDNGKLESPYPGKLYDIGGYRLHLFCSGTAQNGLPTVLFESGSGGHSTEWLFIQKAVSKQTRVCSYDRAGYGWSDEWPALKGKSALELTPRTIDQSVEALDHLLTKAGISGPILLVGHSYGGPMALNFEAQFPNRVSGLILIDPHDDGDPREDENETEVISAALKDLEKEKSLEGKVIWELKLKEITQHLVDSQISPQTLKKDLTALVNSFDPMKWLRAVFSEWARFHSSCAKVKANPSKTLARKPLTVISSDPTLEKSESQTYFHMKIAKQSNQGRFLTAKGIGHDIPSDHPDLVIKVIAQMLEGLEGKTPAQLKEETLPQLSLPTRFFLDGELADSVRTHTKNKEGHEKLRTFCRQLGLGFQNYSDFGYFDDQRTGIRGYFAVCR